MVRGVVFVAVGEHESDVSGKLLRIPVLPTVHPPLRERLERKETVLKLQQMKERTLDRDKPPWFHTVTDIHAKQI
jgi:hypothetical protein